MRITGAQFVAPIEKTSPGFRQVPCRSAIGQAVDHDVSVHVAVNRVPECIRHPQPHLVRCHSATGIEPETDQDRAGRGNALCALAQPSLPVSWHRIDPAFTFCTIVHSDCDKIITPNFVSSDIEPPFTIISSPLVLFPNIILPKLTLNGISSVNSLSLWSAVFLVLKS